MIFGFARSKFFARALIISVAFWLLAPQFSAAVDAYAMPAFSADGSSGAPYVPYPTHPAHEMCARAITNYGNTTATNIRVKLNLSTDVAVPGPDPQQPPDMFLVSQGTLAPQPYFTGYPPFSFNFWRWWTIPSLAPGEKAYVAAAADVPLGKYVQISYEIDRLALPQNDLGGLKNVGCSSGPPPVDGGGSGNPPGGGGGNPSFSLDCNPITTSIVAGSPAAYDLSITTDADFNSPVTITAQGVPSPATYGISPRNILGGTFAKSAIVHINNTQGVVPNTYTIHFVGTAGANQQIADCNLEVRSATHALTGHVSGQGSITATPSGVPPLSSCASNCSATYPDGQLVTIIATPQNNSTFAGWQDGPCSGINSCIVTMTQDMSVTAKFNSGTSGGPGNNFNLSGNVIGSGSITASPAGSPAMTGCTTSCTSSFVSGENVVVSADPGSGATFDGWIAGPCTGTRACAVTMTSNISVTAKFSGGSSGGPCTGTSCVCVGVGCPSSGGPPSSGPPSSGPPTGGPPSGSPPSISPPIVVTVPPPTNVITDNGICEKILIKWTAPAVGADGYNIYRSSTSGSWGTPLNTNPLASSPTEYLDSGAAAGSSYYYAVASLKAGKESIKVSSAISPINVKSCAPDLSSSDKDVIRVNGLANVVSGHLPIPCSNGTDPVKVVEIFHEGDLVRFAINLCNTGVLDAKKLSFIDQLTNLTEPVTGWRASYNGVAITPVVSGTVPNQILTFENLGDIPAPAAPETVEFRVIVFEAQVTSPKPGTVGEYRFQNQGNIFMNNNPAKHIQTPSYLFSGGPAIPKRNEQRL